MKRETKKPESPEPPSQPFVGLQLDAGIRTAVEILRAQGVETFESCEGGEGHAYPEPTIAFHGEPYAGWKVVSICLSRGLPIKFIRRVWRIQDDIEPVGPRWEVVFRRRME